MLLGAYTRSLGWHLPSKLFGSTIRLQIGIHNWAPSWAPALGSTRERSNGCVLNDVSSIVVVISRPGWECNKLIAEQCKRTTKYNKHKQLTAFGSRPTLPFRLKRTNVVRRVVRGRAGYFFVASVGASVVPLPQLALVGVAVQRPPQHKPSLGAHAPREIRVRALPLGSLSFGRAS